MNIYEGNLSYEVNEEDLQEAFEVFGQVESVRIIKDKYSGRPKGFGFVTPREPNSHGDLFIPPSGTGEAMAGDTVLAKVKRQGKRGGQMRYSGEIIEVLERAPLNESMKLDREGLVRRAEERSAAADGASGAAAAGSLEEHALGSRLASDQERMSP